MDSKKELIIFILFLIFILGILIYLKCSHVYDRGVRLENRPLIIDSLFNDIFIYGELIEIKEFKSGGRTTSICCIKIVEGSIDSFYYFNRKMRIAFKIENNIAVKVGCHWYENLKYIDINNNYPGLVTMYDDRYNEIRQIPLSSTFVTHYIYEKDLKLCDHLIKD